MMASLPRARQQNLSPNAVLGVGHFNRAQMGNYLVSAEANSRPFLHGITSVLLDSRWDSHVRAAVRPVLAVRCPETSLRPSDM